MGGILAPTKRGFLGGLLGLVAMPAVVKAGSLMPISVWKEPLRWASTEGCPRGWVHCDGGLLRTRDYPFLFAAIGNAHGGDGATTFAVPKLEGIQTWRFKQNIVKIMNAEDWEDPLGAIKNYIAPIPQPENTFGFRALTGDEAKRVGDKYSHWENNWASSGRVFWPSPDFLEAHPIFVPWPK